MPRRLIILGSTGSIGTSTLDVVAHLNHLHSQGQYPDRFDVVALAAGNNASLLADQAARFKCIHTACARPDSTATFRGPTAALDLVRAVDCDLVMAAIVGSAGLPATLAAVELGRDVALANKETLVAAGTLVIPAAVRSGSRLLPVDSEHSGVWQALMGIKPAPLAPPLKAPATVRRVTLTASGGPFRTWSPDQVRHATREQALRHPTWSMGTKVTIDSASLMNKALELIEAHWLFDLSPETLGAIIHPQSIVHAIVELTDASVLAQLATPDMRTPIQAALTFPRRNGGLAPRLDLASLSRLDFESPDPAKFPALSLADTVMRRGQSSGAILNAANEEAVAAFLDPSRNLPFHRIAELAREALDTLPVAPLRDLADLAEAEAQARALVRRRAAVAPVGVR
ncbi:MAG: 1-deoxy-D-xylulose-5-phosphate reductoisomerase [Phycisphaerae bacterium]|nr:1-deoxy-D-xylulose-5-phosphate reductoisomerase [Phycisphaerae bacterium]